MARATRNSTVVQLMRSLFRRLEIARDMAVHAPLVPDWVISIHERTLAAIRAADFPADRRGDGRAPRPARADLGAGDRPRPGPPAARLPSAGRRPLARAARRLARAGSSSESRFRLRPARPSSAAIIAAARPMPSTSSRPSPTRPSASSVFTAISISRASVGPSAAVAEREDAEGVGLEVRVDRQDQVGDHDREADRQQHVRRQAQPDADRGGGEGVDEVVQVVAVARALGPPDAGERAVERVAQPVHHQQRATPPTATACRRSRARTPPRCRSRPARRAP